MTPARRRKETVLAVVVALGVLLIVFGWPFATVWHAKRQAWERIANIPPRDKATLNCALAGKTLEIPAAPASARETIYSIGDYEFRLPAGAYRKADFSNDAIESDKLQVRFLSVQPRITEFSPAAQPTDESLRRWFQNTDPYDVLVAAFNATPAGIRKQTTHAGLQEHLYLLLLKSAHQPIGSERLFLQFRANGRRGILAGDLSCEMIIVLLYLGETKEFAELLISGKEGSRMSDVYGCLGQLMVRPGGPATATSPAP